MSASVQPFSKAARGRLPLRPWVRVVIVGAVIVVTVFVITWLFVLPGGQKPPSPSSAMWSAGAPMKLPVTPDTPAPSGLPAPAANTDTGIPGPPPAQLVQPMRMWGGAGDSGSLQPHTRPVDGSGRAASGDEGGNPNTELAQRLTPTANHATEAEVDQDISLLLPEGTTFGCLPLSPIDTQLVGSVTCTADEEVWSADGTNRLIDKGAFVTGEIQRGLGLGQNRAFILWHRVRSKRVRATLDSPGVDALGQMGVPGVLDEHLWEKIKATALLTGVEGLGQAGQNLASRGNGNSYVNFSNGQSLAQTALQHDINIPTTLWRGQAWPLRIRVEHDVWFRRAYGDVLVAGAAR
jgi:type IV secretion system protein VirB10